MSFSTKHRKILQCFFIAIYAYVTLVSCATTNVAPIGTEPYHLAEDEKEIWLQCSRLERELIKKGLIYESLTEYINRIGQRLVPEEVKKNIDFRFYIIKDPALNAFALPNGGVYIHTGLLARAENEAQIAHVLGHEITHTINRHALKHTRDLSNKTQFFKILDLITTPVTAIYTDYGLSELALNLIYAAAVTGYGRDLEREADIEGIRLMFKAGYQIEEAPKIYELLMKEYDDQAKLENFFFSSHPRNQERITNTREFINAHPEFKDPNLIINAEQFQQRTHLLVRENAVLDLEKDRYRHAIAGLEKFLKITPKDPAAHFYLGEAHRLIAENPEKVKAEEAQRKGNGKREVKVNRSPEEQKAEALKISMCRIILYLKEKGMISTWKKR